MNRRAGVVTAFVKEVDAKQGRIKVEYRGMEDNLQSAWAYIAAPMSGKKRGALFMPEAGDEVLVTFGDGDFGHPFILGFLWNGEQVSPETEAQNRVIVTPGGHQLRFEDKEGAKRVVLQSKAGHQLEIKDQDGKVTLTTKSGGKVTLDDIPGKVTIEASQNKISMGPDGITIQVIAGQLKISSQAATTIEANGLTMIKSTAAMSIQSTAAIDITAGAVLNVSAAMANFSGVVRASALVANAVVSPVYSPGLGNLI